MNNKQFFKQFLFFFKAIFKQKRLQIFQFRMNSLIAVLILFTSIQITSIRSDWFPLASNANNSGNRASAVLFDFPISVGPESSAELELEPLQIVANISGSAGDTPKFGLNLAALKQVFHHPKCANRPVHIVAITGKYRKGKSFMLNFFLRYLQWQLLQNATGTANSDTDDWLNMTVPLKKHFQWKSGSAPHTKGIFVWPEPFVIKQKSGEVAVLLMDTQGIFDYMSSMEENSMIFSLAAISSSTLVSLYLLHIRVDQIRF